MEYIQIPVPDFSFTDFAKERANEVFEDELDEMSYFFFDNPQMDDSREYFNRLDRYLNDFASKEEQLVYLAEILILLTNSDNEAKKSMIESDYLIHKKEINKAKRFFYKQATIIGYNFDTNTFPNEEIIDLNRKINAILIKLDEIQVGNEVIFNEVEELKIKLKEDFESLKSDYPLGKKRWYQRAAGVVVSYSGTKAADEVLHQLKPELHDFFTNHILHIIDKL